MQYITQTPLWNFVTILRLCTVSQSFFLRYSFWIRNAVRNFHVTLHVPTYWKIAFLRCTPAKLYQNSFSSTNGAIECDCTLHVDFLCDIRFSQGSESQGEETDIFAQSLNDKLRVLTDTFNDEETYPRSDFGVALQTMNIDGMHTTLFGCFAFSLCLVQTRCKIATSKYNNEETYLRSDFGITLQTYVQ